MRGDALPRSGCVATGRRRGLTHRLAAAVIAGEAHVVLVALSGVDEACWVVESTCARPVGRLCAAPAAVVLPAVAAALT